MNDQLRLVPDKFAFDGGEIEQSKSARANARTRRCGANFGAV